MMPHDSLAIPAHRLAVPEESVQRFEDSWQQGQSPDIDEYLTGEGQTRHALLIELVHTDLEYRLKSGEPSRIESYIQRFPELQADLTALLGLVAAEYELRARRDPDLHFEDYFERFPDHRSQLCELRGSLQAVRPHQATRICCPQCREAIALPSDSKDAEIACPTCGAKMCLEGHASSDSLRFPHTKSLGKFEILESLGVGAFGAVYKARDTQLDRVVAIKIPRLGGLTSNEDRERFLREARHVAQLSHAGIIPLYEVSQTDGVPYLVSEFVEGKTLAEIASRTPPTFRQVAQWVAEVAEILQYSHDHGIVHRDVKPANIIVNPDGAPRLMDFGLAKCDTAETVVSLDGRIVGTPAYLSPEQARGDEQHVDGRSDVYSIGVVLYELLTGELPFRGIPRMILPQVLYDDPRPPRRLNDKIPTDLEAITLKCMEKEPKRRYQSAAQLAADLHRWLNRESVRARPVRAWGRAIRWTRRRPTLTTLVAAILILATASLTLITWKWREAIAAHRATAEALTLAETRRTDAERQRDQAVRERARADRNFNWVRTTLSDLWTKINEDPEMRRAPLQPTLDELLTSAIAFYEGIGREKGDDPQLQADRGRAYWQRAYARANKAQPEPALALDDFQQMEAIFAQLSTEFPDNEDYQALLGWSLSSQGNVLRELHKYDDASKAFDKAVGIFEKLRARSPTNPDHAFRLGLTYASRGYQAQETGELTAAADWYRQALNTLLSAPPPKGTQLARDHHFHLHRTYDLLVGQLARAAQWDDAAELCGKTVAFDPGDPMLWYDYAIVLLAAGQKEKYREVCANMLAHFATTNDPAAAARLLYTCLPGPNAVPDADRLIPLARLAITQWKGSYRLLGGALYRAGQYADAVDAIEEALTIHTPRGWDWFFSAMAYYQAGRRADAERWLTEGIRWHEEMIRRDPNCTNGEWGWTERVENQQLRNEAEALIHGQKPEPR